jgi:uncharacterized membrane protein (DUF485 family)
MSTHAALPQVGNGEARARPEVDWVAAENSPEFRRLTRAKRSFVVPATIFFFAWYFGFILLAGYAESFMGKSIYQGFTVGYALALTQFVMVWGLGVWYVRKATREWDPLAARARERAEEQAEGPYTERSPMGIVRPGPAGDRELDREEVARR